MIHPNLNKEAEFGLKLPIHPIPVITDPLGKHWQQPALEMIAVYKNCAVMNQDTFNKLLDYSHSQPSGTYIGKMWKSKIEKEWFLVWFSKNQDPKFLTNNYREIIIV